MSSRMFLIGAALVAATPVVAQTAPAPVPAAAPADPARLAAARKLVDVILPPEERQAVFTRMIEAFLANMLQGLTQSGNMQATFQQHPEAKTVFANFVSRQRELTLEDLKQQTPALIDAYARAFSRHYSIEEMEAIGAFFVTPAGQKYRAMNTWLLSDPDMAKWQADVMRQSQARAPAELKKLQDQLEPILRTKAKTNAS